MKPCCSDSSRLRCHLKCRMISSFFTNTCTTDADQLPILSSPPNNHHVVVYRLQCTVYIVMPTPPYDRSRDIVNEIITKIADMAVFKRGWLPHRGKAQVACNLLFPHEDNIPNKSRILKEMHIQMRKPYQLPGLTKNSSYDLPPP